MPQIRVSKADAEEAQQRTRLLLRAVQAELRRVDSVLGEARTGEGVVVGRQSCTDTSTRNSVIKLLFTHISAYRWASGAGLLAATSALVRLLVGTALSSFEPPALLLTGVMSPAVPLSPCLGLIVKEPGWTPCFYVYFLEPAHARLHFP